MKRTVIALVDDLFWRTKIDHAVQSAGATTTFISDPAALVSVDPERTPLILVDLSLKQPPFEGIAALKKLDKAGKIPVVGYFEHVRKDLRDKAVAAGCDVVLSRSSFSERFADILMKYALPGGVKTESEETELPEE